MPSVPGDEKTIWKFPLEISFVMQLRSGQIDVKMPRASRVLSVGVQKTIDDEQIVVWAEVFQNSTAQPETHRFIIRTTGGPFQGPAGVFIGTVQLYNGAFVGHVYEVF